MLGAFAKLRKATISFVKSILLSVCLAGWLVGWLVGWLAGRPAVRVEQLGFHLTDFHEILYLPIFRNSVQKIQVSFKSDKNIG